MGVMEYVTRGREFSLLSIVRALWIRKTLIAVLWLLGSAGVVAYVFSLRAVYRADAVILVEAQKIPENFVAATVQAAMEVRMDALKQQVLSRDRLWSLINQFHLYAESRPTHTREEVVAQMRDDVIISLERAWTANRPGAFRIQYEAFIPEVAAKVVNHIALFFINENVRQREVEAEGTSEFLVSQLEEAQKRLQKQEAKLKEFKLANMGELPEQQATLLASMAQSRVELQGIQEAIARAQQNKIVLENSLSAAQSSVESQRSLLNRSRTAAVAATSVHDSTRSSPPVQVSSERTRLESQLRAARLRYHDTHPEVRQLRFELERLSSEEAQQSELQTRSRGATVTAAGGETAASGSAASAATTGVDVERESLLRAETQRVQLFEAQLSAVMQEIQNLEVRRGHLTDDAEEVADRLRRIPVREQELTSLMRDYDTSRRDYDSLLSKKLAADLATNMERSQKAQRFVMLDPARIPEKPVRPRRVLLCVAGMAFWLVAVASIAFLLELKNNVLLGEWELPSGTVVLGRVPHVSRT